MIHFYAAGSNGLAVFLFATIVLGGGAAFLMGRAVAGTWRPVWQLAWYALLIAFGVRFVHYAMFAEPLMSAPSLAVDWLAALAGGLSGFRLERSRQMAESYPWLDDRN